MCSSVRRKDVFHDSTSVCVLLLDVGVRAVDIGVSHLVGGGLVARRRYVHAAVVPFGRMAGDSSIPVRATPSDEVSGVKVDGKDLRFI